MYSKEWVIPVCGCELSRGGEGILYIRYCSKHKAAPELYEALKNLIEFNWMNKGNDGKTCPHPIEFIACYTFGAGNIPEVYRKADQALSKAEAK